MNDDSPEQCRIEVQNLHDQDFIWIRDHHDALVGMREILMRRMNSTEERDESGELTDEAAELIVLLNCVKYCCTAAVLAQANEQLKPSLN